ncbi:hematopoietic SH2 domain-containing protein homolog [Corythoichthys intestinalis]|uniref:hematopoietic SH2 domain-containing protein homolog n=1 Tax=Corythoichthys intestinalis TaxID=161448 RepID=UPI0025A550D4|nr:hematopoietic SH2 domain-containing protein homolog [Corythoichthys intestinalis]XP_057698220.1 hematopoietic SH2 domain-containing protein homolog [Corythoichthys intestinalis]
MTELSQLTQPRNNTFIGVSHSQPTWKQNGVVPEWFHWKISRKSAEELLMSKPSGSFLIRVSESRVGYTLSYRVKDHFRHFMIDTKEDGSCAIVGEKGRHPSLQQLVDFHRNVPISTHNELLTLSCGQTPPVADIKTSEDSSVNSNKIPIISKVPSLDHQNNNENHSQTHPVVPVPKTRKRYLTDITPPVEPLKTNPESSLTTNKTEVAPVPTLDHQTDTNTERTALSITEELQMSWEQLFDAALSAYNDEGDLLQPEYRPPPPFAPGYSSGPI